MSSLHHAEEFLQTTDAAYDECSNGIKDLDRIIVSVSSALSGRTRFYLIPMLYAHWERFFKISFAEYLRCISIAGRYLLTLDQDLARSRVLAKFRSFLKKANVKTISELPDKYSIAEITYELNDLTKWFNDPISFDPTDEIVRTESNVGPKVLETNCRRLGVDMAMIKSELPSDQPLFPHLKKLVSARNEIAHGGSPYDITAADWEQHKRFVLNLMNALQLTLYYVVSAV